ncbi:MAG: ABC transporter substrate-binding protein [Clostridia bacterium]|jgi:raffinose/stachyose/melibiose transport system substrate-binding protein|nr:extracellular solute-binding protein [Spirochaetia bacterium]
MFKKIVAVTIMMAVLVSFAAAAGSSEQAAVGGKTTIRFFHRWPMEPRFSYFNQIVAEFEAQNPDIKIEMDSVENDAYKEKIRVLISSNDVPDVFVSWSDSFAFNLVKSGRVRALNDLLEKDKAFANSFIKSQIGPFTFGGITYGMPLTIDGKVLVYNKAIWAEAGITKEPRTFEELLTVLDTLKAKGHAVPILEGLSNAWAISHYQGTMLQRYLPAEVLAKDYAEATGEFSHPGYKVVLERFQRLVDYMGPNATSLTHTEVRNQFIAGKLPMMYMQLAEFAYIQAAASKPDFGYFNFPAFSDGQGDPGLLTGAPEGFMMSNTSKNPEAAERFFKFLLSKENAYKFVKDVGAPVAILGAVTNDNSYPALMDAITLINSVSGSAPWFDNAVNVKVADAFMRGSQAVASKDKTVEQVVADIQAAAKVVKAEATK